MSSSTIHDIHILFLGCGHFAYYEASYRAKGHAAYLATLMFVPMQSQYCFSFYVSMYTRYPRYMGSLHVYLVNGLTYSQTLLWENYGVLTYNASHWKNINIDVDVVVGGTNMSVSNLIDTLLFIFIFFVATMLGNNLKFLYQY